MSNLLATIVATHRLAPEPVATDALVHLCATSEAAATAMSALLVDLCPGAVTSGLRFTGQDIALDADGRPDLVAVDTTGTRLIVEAKFDAALTRAQVSGAYVDRLTTGVPGALVFLVPRDRMRNLWRTISVTPGGAPAPADLPVGSEDTGLAKMPLGESGHVLAVVSWESMLHRLRTVVEGAGDVSGAAELEQIAGLVQWRTSAGWVPVMPEDLPPRVGRQLQALTETLKTVCARSSTTKIKRSGAEGGVGHKISTPSGKEIWIGVWLNWWGAHGPGPAWAQVSLSTIREMALTAQALAGAGVDHHTRQQFRDVLIPLDLAIGAEQETVEAELMSQVGTIIAAVDVLAVEVVAVSDADEDDPTGT